MPGGETVLTPDGGGSEVVPEKEPGLEYVPALETTGGLMAAVALARRKLRQRRNRLSLSGGPDGRRRRRRPTTFKRMEKDGLLARNTPLPEINKRLSTGVIQKSKDALDGAWLPMDSDAIKRLSAKKIIEGKDLSDVEKIIAELVLYTREQYEQGLVDSGIISEREAKRSSQPQDGETLVQYIDRLERQRIFARRRAGEETPEDTEAEAQAA